jgi:transposase InsO family protein
MPSHWAYVQPLPRLPSYSTVRRFFKAQGLFRQRRKATPPTAGSLRAEQRLAAVEVRSFEVEHVNGLWHLDFHQGSRPVLTAQGQWVPVALLGVLDDRSRLAAHAQWYLAETAETLAHGFAQAIQKRGLPRALMTDQGSAMLAAEIQRGLLDLGILHEPTLPYSPHQNGKQEVFWAAVEGRLLAMLEGVRELTLALLNAATQAWVELDYNQKRHAELGETPLARYLRGPDVGRESPDSEALRRAFRLETSRHQRRSDGTAIQRRKPFRADLHYLITAWATEPDDEHRLLARSMKRIRKWMHAMPDRPANTIPMSIGPQSTAWRARSVRGSSGRISTSFPAKRSKRTT